MKRMIISSAIEYQGISIINRDIPKIKKVFQKKYPKLTLRPNLHVCLDYFGIRKQSDTHIVKTQEMFDEKIMGRQIDIHIIGMGYYERKNNNGQYELMNVSLLIDDSYFDQIVIGDKTLTDYNKKNMPWITLYTNPKTVMLNDKEIPVSTAKHSGKCFGVEPVDETERYDFEMFDEPFTVTGELCVFRGGLKYFHVKDDTTRLVTWKTIREEQQDMLNTEFEAEKNKEEQTAVNEINKKLST